MAGSLGAFLITRRVVSDQEQRALKERTGEVAALLSSSTGSTTTSLEVLGALGSLRDPEAVRLFGLSGAPLTRRGSVALAVAVADPQGFTVVAAIGDGPVAGTRLTGDRARLVARALASRGLVTVLVSDPKGKRLISALRAPGRRQAVAYQESVVRPSTPIPSSANSAFRELRVALYTARTADTNRLLLTTEARLPLTGRVERVPFQVGTDTWLLTVGARSSLVGSFANLSPWLILAGGLLTGLLAAAVVEILARRRTYALDLVAERTEELDETRAFLERLLSAAPVVVRRITMPDRRISYVSPNVERLFGVTEAEARAPELVINRVHGDDQAAFGAALDRVAEGSSAREEIEYRLRRTDDSSGWVAAVLVPELDSDGAIVAVLWYSTDVDGRHRAEDAQREAQEAADQANRAKSEFLSRMSHELRTPLNAVLGFGQLLELDPLTDEQSESVEQILKGGRHLLDLINEVLDISRIEAGELGLSPEPVLARELIQETVDLIRPIADQRGIQLIVERSASCDCYVYADRQRAKQVLLNLMSNAVKYNRLRGTVAISCEEIDPTRVAISVLDTGPGIAAERLGLLFIPFERLGAEDTDVEGTGIGLALSQRLTEAMSGALLVSSVLGKGSTFTFELPRVEGPVERFERLNGDAEIDIPVGPDRRKILHIEDNLSNLKLVERIFARRDDVDVVAAMHGRLGLELAHEHQPALILLDLHLPDMDGDHVLQRLRDDPVTASIPVVMVSADATPGQVRRLLSAGATAYLTKPIEVSDLLNVLNDALGTADVP
ncbi:MAG: sensor protein [Acidimicrobiales bacterium]|nr:sensor protein [Acidimicrobiales bacterium]